MRILLIVFLITSFGGRIIAQDNCPQPRVQVSNDIDYYDQQNRSPIEHYEISLNTAVANTIISLNRGSIRFFSSFTAAVPIGEMDYFLTVKSKAIENGVRISMDLVDNNNRVVLNYQSTVNDSLWVENIIDIANVKARDVSPLVQKIETHQYDVRNGSEAAISSKFELEKRSYQVKVNEKKKIKFVLKDCDDEILPGRTVVLELEGKEKIDKTTCTVDENGVGEFTYTAPKDNGKATVTLAHKYESVSGLDNRISVDAVEFITSGKLWLLVNHVTDRAEIYIVGEHIGGLEMKWDDSNTRGGSVASFSADDDHELWSTSLVGFIEMDVLPAGKEIWTANESWFPGPTTIKARQLGGYEFEIIWPLEDGSTMPVRGTITYEKPRLFDQARSKYLAAKRGS
ncbi:hypothetical protein [Muriicola marianensis]|uniref:Carboxypeptidase regulatory-like domain-containing protein n=1 Tax=Muriicola marianensis TaxID=1324801 RepID=A0ABQ1QRN0_9FLAO|nr:hypothetical protein [Muriicola marianensis]GGD40333.1 hypothetical protein GCM10011361_04320 [Muriicola marianensis]